MRLKLFNRLVFSIAALFTRSACEGAADVSAIGQTTNKKLLIN